MPSALNTPVFILGGGPVGLCHALFLNHWGVNCTILNVGEATRKFPKGNGENSRTMEHFRQIGLADEVRTLFPEDHKFDQAYFKRSNAWEIYRAPNPAWSKRKKMRAEMPADDQYPEPMFHTNQMYLEAYLLKKVKSAEHVDVWFGWEAVEFDQSDDGVKVTAKKASDETKTQTWVAEYLADCGGGTASYARASVSITRATFSLPTKPTGPATFGMYGSGSQSSRDACAIVKHGSIGPSTRIQTRAALSYLSTARTSSCL